MAIDEFEKRPAERQYPIDGAAGFRMSMRRAKYLVNATEEQFILVAEVFIERRAANVGTVQDLGDGNRAIGLLARESDEGVLQRRSRSPYSPVSCIRTIRS